MVLLCMPWYVMVNATWTVSECRHSTLATWRCCFLCCCCCCLLLLLLPARSSSWQTSELQSTFQFCCLTTGRWSRDSLINKASKPRRVFLSGSFAMALERDGDNNVQQQGNAYGQLYQVSHAIAETKALVPVLQQSHQACVDVEDSSGSMATASREGSLRRDLVLAKVTQEKTLSLIKAWEENEMAKSLNRYNKKVAKILAWEIAKKATAEAKFRTLEEKLERKRAGYVEKMKNEIARVHRKAKEERAFSQACYGEESLHAEEMAAKYRATGKIPKKFPFCLGG